MGVLSYPRIHFRGQITFNPATADNDDVAMEIDPVNVKLLPKFSSWQDGQVLAFLKEGIQAVSIINKQPFEYLRGGWNIFGDLTTEFVDTSISGVVGLDGRFDPYDAVVGSAFSIIGTPPDPKIDDDPPSKPKICDIDPTGSATCQLILGGIQLGGDTLGLKAEFDTKAFGRSVMFRNAAIYPGEQNFPGAGAVWQFAIPYDSLTFINPNQSHDPATFIPTSPALYALDASAKKARGIVVEFATFQVVPELTDAQLIAAFKENPSNMLVNPALGSLVGTIGIWEKGEAATASSDRRLLPPADSSALQTLVGPAAAYLGVAGALVQRNKPVVSLNLITTFPESGYGVPLSKANLGNVRLGVIPANEKTPVPISDPIDYGYHSYEMSSGILDVICKKVDRDTLDKGTLVLLTDSAPDIPLLTETPQVVTVVSTGDNDTGIYLDVGGSVDISILVQERGGPPSIPVTVYLWEFQYVTDPGDDHTRALSLLHMFGTGMVTCRRLDFPATVPFHKGSDRPDKITVKALSPGGAVIAFTTDENAPTGPYPWGTAIYTALRVLPEDHFSHLHAKKKGKEKEKIKWNYMYDTVFKYYRLIFPAMSNIIPFDNQGAMEAAAQEILKLTDPNRKDSTRYMPVSRDLSSGKRDLIVAWAKQHPQKRGVPPQIYLWP